MVDKENFSHASLFSHIRESKILAYRKSGTQDPKVGP